ncbi:MAG TPA: spore photoproduct lyase family protein [Abditibacterium sp.]
MSRGYGRVFTLKSGTLAVAERLESMFSETSNLPQNLLDIDTIYLEPTVENYARGKEILAQFPEARRIEVPSHWQILGLNGNEGNASDWLKIKRNILVLGVRKAMKMDANGRSSDFIAPSTASGCAMACAYCYVPRRKGFANPITTFVNIEQIAGYIARHANKQGFKMTPTAPDDDSWIYEIGCNSDVSVDAAVCDNTRDLIEMFRTVPNSKATFATKWVNRDLLNLDPQGKTRIRFSLMPHDMARLVDVRTSPIRERIAAINNFVEAGYEVNVNFSPVIVKEGFLDDYDALFEEVNDSLSPAAKAQMKAEIIFLTHHRGLHEVNLQWHPKAEEVLWTPDSQENKTSQMGGSNVRYKVSLKQPLVKQFCERMQAKMPYCGVRYAF